MYYVLNADHRTPTTISDKPFFPFNKWTQYFTFCSCLLFHTSDLLHCKANILEFARCILNISHLWWKKIEPSGNKPLMGTSPRNKDGGKMILNPPSSLSKLHCSPKEAIPRIKNCRGKPKASASSSSPMFAGAKKSLLLWKFVHKLLLASSLAMTVVTSSHVAWQFVSD